MTEQPYHNRSPANLSTIMALEEVEIDEQLDFLSSEIKQYYSNKKTVVHEIKKLDEEILCVIQGFPGIGFLGPIVSDYLLQVYPSKKVAGVMSPVIPPLIHCRGAEINYPITIRKLDNFPIVVAIADIPIPDLSLMSIGEAMKQYYKKIDAKCILMIDGLFTRRKKWELDDPCRYLITKNAKFDPPWDAWKNLKVPEHKEPLVGITAILFQIIDIPIYSLLTETIPSIPDITSAKFVLQEMNKLLKAFTGESFEVDHEKLFQIKESFITKFTQIFSVSEDFFRRLESPEKKIEETHTHHYYYT